jgi:hypothetical protein
VCCINSVKAELLKRKTGWGVGVRRKKNSLEGEIRRGRRKSNLLQGFQALSACSSDSSNVKRKTLDW